MLLLETAVTTTELSGAFVVAMGMGTVFIGLICIILLIKIMSLIINGVAKDEAAKPAAPVAAPVAAPAAPVAPADPDDITDDELDELLGMLQNKDKKTEAPATIPGFAAPKRFF